MLCNPDPEALPNQPGFCDGWGIFAGAGTEHYTPVRGVICFVADCFIKLVSTNWRDQKKNHSEAKLLWLLSMNTPPALSTHHARR